MSVLAAAEAQLPLVKGDDGQIMTQQFLSVCKLVFPVIGESERKRGVVAAPRRRPKPRPPPPFSPVRSKLDKNTHTRTDKLGAAFAIVKMDIGGNIDVR
jgi:hypothetical protein